MDQSKANKPTIFVGLAERDYTARRIELSTLHRFPGIFQVASSFCESF